MKSEVSLDKAQGNGAQAQDRIALWVEVVASVLRCAPSPSRRR